MRDRSRATPGREVRQSPALIGLAALTMSSYLALGLLAARLLG